MKEQRSVLLEYVFKNKKSFIIILTIFFIGMVIGIFLVNNANYNQKEEILEYVQKLEENIKGTSDLNTLNLLFSSLKENIIFIILIWFLGCTIVGSIFIYLAVCYKGIMLRLYNISNNCKFEYKIWFCIFNIIIVAAKFVFITSRIFNIRKWNQIV